MNVIKGFLGLEFTQFAEQYFITRFSSGRDINYGDAQTSNSMNIYGDAFTDTILKLCTDHVSNLTEKSLLPTYSWVRFYQKGDELKIHTDRPECEYSATVCLSTPSDQPQSALYFNKNCSKKGKGVEKIILERGDLCIYKGCDYYHWREPIESDWLLQFFMHWVDGNGPYRDSIFDRRPSLGVPK